MFKQNPPIPPSLPLYPIYYIKSLPYKFARKQLLLYGCLYFFLMVVKKANN